jgi:8-oxo-dGTP pyrophosphatase MutT (NUDIX family)
MARREAASVLIWTEDGRVLGITRGIDAKNVTMPGGRQDPGDRCRCATPHHAEPYATAAHNAARELYEETGVKVRPEALIPLVRDGLHTTFYASEIDFWPAHLASRPFEGFVALWPPHRLTAPTCTYSEQNRRLFTMVGLQPDVRGART